MGCGVVEGGAKGRGTSRLVNYLRVSSFKSLS